MLLTFALHAPAQDEKIVLVPVEREKPVPLFFSARTDTAITAGIDRIEETITATLRVHQGRPELLSLGLTGTGEITGVSGDGLRTWTVRREADGTRFLDLKPELPADPKAETPMEFTVTIAALHDDTEQPIDLLLPAPGAAVGFASTVRLSGDGMTSPRVLAVEGLQALKDEGETRHFSGNGAGRLNVKVELKGAAPRPVEIGGAMLEGTISSLGDSVSFVLRGVVTVTRAGEAMTLLDGVALDGATAGDGWFIRLRKSGERYMHELVGEREGTFPIELPFEAALVRQGDWRGVDFKLHGGAVVPVTVAGVGEGVSFKPGEAVVPELRDGAWTGYLPATGQATFSWKSGTTEGEGTLFFSSSELAELRVDAGLARRTAVLGVRVLQGKLESLSVTVDGRGEILAVKGPQVLAWTVGPEENGSRVLDVRFSRPIEGEGSLEIESQAALGAFPATLVPPRFTPVGAIRHSGFLRVATSGAVRLEVAAKSGLMQLSPAQFPGATAEDALRQVFVYRFPSGEYDYEVSADQVLPEVGVTEVTVHELGETDRRLAADLELDIREAPVREWTVMVPADFAVASVTGAGVADYAPASGEKDGKRELKILFAEPVIGRHLVTVALEKNQAAAAGDWTLPVLGHPGAKSVRGYVGAVVTAGFRAVPGAVEGLAETPVDFFPKKLPGLQQAFRMREGAWSATLKVEALGQSIQADVFHLYSLKEGAVTGSVLVNYFVVGAPASQWRIRVPESLGNVEVTGQNVGRDWRREGDTLVIPLARPVLGAGTVLVTFEQPMNARGGSLSPGEVRPLDVQSERGYVQVVSPLQVKVNDVAATGSVLQLEAAELPTEYRLLSSAPTLAAWQYTAGDVAIRLDFQWYEAGETTGQVVDFAKLSSHVSRDGQVVTEARYFVKSRGQEMLELVLPEGNLWESLVNGEPVNARRDGDHLLIPLPAKADPDEPVEVVLRYGTEAGTALKNGLSAPVLRVPVVSGEWRVTGDEGRRLVPGGGLRPVKQPLTETGLQWIVARAKVAALMVLVMALAGEVVRQIRGLRFIGVLLLAGSAGTSLWLAARALEERRVNLLSVDYQIPVLPAGHPVVLELSNASPFWAMVSVPGLLLLIAGIALAVYSRVAPASTDRTVRRGGLIAGVTLVALGVLAQRFGAVAFFAGAGALLLLGKVLPSLVTLLRRPGKAVAATAAVLLLCGISGNAKAGDIAAESMRHNWDIRDGRLNGTILVEARGAAEDRLLLLSPPAVLTGFTGEGWKVVKSAHGDGEAYFLVATAEGLKTGRATFEMPLPEAAQGWSIPVGPAAVQNVKVQWEEPGWEFHSPDAASVRPLLIEAGSGAELVLRPADGITLQPRPMQRDAASEETRFFAETQDLFLPGPGLVGGRHRVEIRPSRGVVKSLTLRIPEGFTVGDVSGGPVGGWRFNPESRELKVAIEPAQQQPFGFSIGTQRGTNALPAEVTLAPVEVLDAAGTAGWLALGFGDDAQAEAVVARGLSTVNADDFDSGLLPRDAEGRPLALLHRAWRHAGGEASLSLKVAAVAPEVRVDTAQTLSLGDDRILLAVDLKAAITRAGVFKLEVDLPDGFEVESVTGAALSHWAESEVDGKRVLNLHLGGRTLGEQPFAIVLTAPFPGAQTSWAMPRVSVRGAARQTGMLTVVPERGLQVRAVNRTNVSQLDPREAGVPGPGALAFKLLQADWSLDLAVAKLDPWVTAQVLHEVTLREGQARSRVRLAYRIDNASLKTLRVRIPGLDESASATVRASGPAVADFVPVAGGEGDWEIRFQRGVAGETTVDVEFQQASGDSVTVTPLVPADVRQMSYFVALRTAPGLEIAAPELPRGWQRGDRGVVPPALQQAVSGELPASVYRAAEVEGPLVVTLQRHGLEKARDLRVERGSLVTLVAPGGSALTAVDLDLRVAEKGTLKLTLPKGAELHSVLVNEDGVPLVKDGDAWRFHVHPAPEGNRPASVRFVYAVTSSSTVLEGPGLDVPLENLWWRVILPEGWRLTGHGGDFELEGQDRGVIAEDYLNFVSNRRAAGKQEAVALLDQASVWMQAGQQDKAGQALSKAARNGLLDQASNEDARVQLRNLKAQQATLALNTRRQRLYLDNRAELSTANLQLEKAAEENPLLQGVMNFDPGQFDRLLEGNSMDENAAMKAIAQRIVQQQLAADPAPAALDVTLTERGTVLSFKRSVQVDGNQPMRLELELAPKQPAGWGFGLILCVLAAATAATLFRRRIAASSAR